MSVDIIELHTYKYRITPAFDSKKGESSKREEEPKLNNFFDGMNLRDIGDNGTKAKGGDGLEVGELYQGFNNMKEGNENKYQRSMLHCTRFLLTSLLVLF